MTTAWNNMESFTVQHDVNYPSRWSIRISHSGGDQSTWPNTCRTKRDAIALGDKLIAASENSREPEDSHFRFCEQS